MPRLLLISIASFLAVAALAPKTSAARLPLLADSGKLTSTSLAADEWRWAFAQHNIGNMNLVVSNFGLWGFGWHEWRDYFTGEAVREGSEYPKNSLVYQLQSAQFWIGGRLGRDTLVSVSFDYNVFLEFELNPAPAPFGEMDTRPLGDPSTSGYQEGVSNQDYIALYTDTVVLYQNAIDFLRGTPHIPLNVLVSQKSYAWSNAFADDFVLFDMNIKNIGAETINDLYFGILSRPSVGVVVGDNHTFDYDHGSIGGFIEGVPSHLGCDIIDTVNMMWGANNDGDPIDGAFTDELVYDPNYSQEWIKSAPDAHAIFFLDYPGKRQHQDKNLSYNWWTPFRETSLDYGPRHREDYRDFMTGGTGWPLGDANRYHVMSNGEIDYDILHSIRVGYDDPVWLPPPAEIAQMASTEGLPGPFTLLSLGPFELPAGASVNLPLAFVCAEDFHVDPANGNNLPGDLDLFYANLNFTNLLENCSWARWIYDNPGIDSDGDDYAGEFVVCDGDTIYYTGDGIPDWRGAVPPPAPRVRVEPVANGLRVRFNGSRSETEKDTFSGEVDFEGYRVYCGRDERVSSFALAATYDRRNYDKYVLKATDNDLQWVIYDPPFLRDSLRCLYGSGADPCADADFDPLSFTPSSPYVHADFVDSAFYFKKHDYNASIFEVNTPIRKVYPDEPDPVIYHADSIPPEAMTDDGYLRYYEYEVVIGDLLPTVPYWVNVTAFDYGDARIKVKPLESAVSVGAVSAYPLGTSDMAADGDGNVYVYPNPYRGDADYRDNGFEGRLQEDRPDYRVREIHFRNLPPRCTIYVYSLDGDLVRKLDHDMDPADPNSSHDSWNMITRNTQMVVSGLYYWVVEAEDGSTQMGKLVIIM
ncbi:MAG: hypothetical protein JSW34_08115 [Candidatus Zixiibacteriota bacterium]|nr:MAG: hypothetical protein JSW34_08115 [candidate division Zixibacteria bacterium]